MSVAFGYLESSGGGLIISNVIGQLFSCLFLGFRIILLYGKAIIKFDWNEIYILGKRYKDFLKFDIFASLFNVATIQFIIIFLGIIFTSTLVGIYSLTNRILTAPIYLVARSILDVFRQKATEEFNKYGRCDKTYIKTFKTLSILSFFPFALLFIFGEDIFGIVFGEQWRQAGTFAKILSPMFFLRFVSSPLSYLFYIAEKQRENLIGQSLLFIFTLISIYIGYYYNNITLLFISISISNSIIYLYYLVFSYRYSLGRV
jgi:O-antigen/teichoic acid export membrane protein